MIKGAARVRANTLLQTVINSLLLPDARQMVDAAWGCLVLYRAAQRNGDRHLYSYRSRDLGTNVGTGDVAILKLRSGTYSAARTSGGGAQAARESRQPCQVKNP